MSARVRVGVGARVHEENVDSDDSCSIQFGKEK